MRRRARLEMTLWTAALVAASSNAGAQSAGADSARSPAVSAAPAELADQVSAMQSTLARLQRTSVTGYVQARAVYQGDVRPTNNLFVRRARLNLRYTGEAVRFALSFDGGQNAVTVKDAYVDWTATPAHGQKQGLVLRAGQFFRPFGFEVERGAPDREMPERPAGWIVLFPGYRDQGADLSIGITPQIVAEVAVLNGGGTSTTSLTFRDPDSRKDVLARVRFASFGPRVDLALSGYLGEQTIPATTTAPAITGDRNRWGVAANVYDALGGTLRAEALWARDITTNLGPGAARETAPGFAVYGQYAHALGARITGVARYDRFDPDTEDESRLGGDGEQDTYAAAVLAQVVEGFRLTLAYEHVRLWQYHRASETSSLEDSDLYTLQTQFRF